MKLNENNHVRNIIASSCATGIAEVATLPICAIKTNYQTLCPTQTSSIGNVVGQIYKTRGIKGFYTASLPAISSQILSTGGKYTLYRLGTSHNIPTVISGISSGIIISVVTHPLDFIRVALQRGENISNISKISISEFIKIFYRGYSKSLTKVIVGSSLFFPIYDFTKRTMNSKLNTNSPIAASMISAIISTTIMQPFDYVKIRNIAGLPWYQGLNPLKYLRGCSLNLLRVVPHFTIVMTLTEKIHTLLQ